MLVLRSTQELFAGTPRAAPGVNRKIPPSFPLNTIDPPGVFTTNGDVHESELLADVDTVLHDADEVIGEPLLLLKRSLTPHVTVECQVGDRGVFGYALTNVLQVEFGGVNLGAVERQGRLRLFAFARQPVDLLLAGDPFFAKRLGSSQVGCDSFEAGLTLFVGGMRLIQFGLVRTSIDFEQQVALLYLGSLLEKDPRQVSGDAGAELCDGGGNRSAGKSA